MKAVAALVAAVLALVILFWNEWNATQESPWLPRLSLRTEAVGWDAGHTSRARHGTNRLRPLRQLGLAHAVRVTCPGRAGSTPNGR